MKLGGDGVASQAVKGAPVRQPPKDVRLVLWKEGFSIDDEPLRRYDDPANKTYLTLIIYFVKLTIFLSLLLKFFSDPKFR